MPAMECESGVHVTRILDRSEPAPGVVLVGLDAFDLARTTRPGQYVMAIPPSGEAAAVALGVYEAEGRRASLLFFQTGKRTRELATLRVGDRLDLFGPLGNGFDLSVTPKRATIVAGGVGIASVLLAAKALATAGASVELLYGARTAELLVDAERFARAGCKLALATDDGSAGHQGFVTELLPGRIRPDVILACGPSAMLRAVGHIARDFAIPAQLSLEETFGCGVGGCWGCVVPVIASSAQAPGFPQAARGGSDIVYARVCREGPVFRSEELRW